jgi:hypothetical protein
MITIIWREWWSALEVSWSVYMANYCWVGNNLGLWGTHIGFHVVETKYPHSWELRRELGILWQTWHHWKDFVNGLLGFLFLLCFIGCYHIVEREHFIFVEDPKFELGFVNSQKKTDGLLKESANSLKSIEFYRIWYMLRWVGGWLKNKVFLQVYWFCDYHKKLIIIFLLLSLYLCSYHGNLIGLAMTW